MKNNKGFTLVELLAVITILALVAVATLEAIDSVNKGNKEKAEKIYIQNILTSAISFVPTSLIILPDETTTNLICVANKTNEYKKNNTNTIKATTNICSAKIYLSRLVEEGILEANLTNPRTNKKLNMDSSYVEILYITTSNTSLTNNVTGKFDGQYFYRIIEVY